MKTCILILALILILSTASAHAANPATTPIAAQRESCARQAEQTLLVSVTDSLPSGAFLQEMLVSAGSLGQVLYSAQLVSGPLAGDSVLQARITTAYSLEPGTPIRVTIVTYLGDQRDDGVSTAHSLVFNCSSGEVEEQGDAAFRDGRINQHPEASAAVFCGDNGAIHVFSIDARGRGEDLFTTTRRELNSVPVNPPANTLVESEPGPRGPIQLWRLHGGLLQIVSPGQAGDNEKNYEFLFSGCQGEPFRP